MLISEIIEKRCIFDIKLMSHLNDLIKEEIETSTAKLIVANVLLPVNSNETLLQELSISLLKNTRKIVFESC
jgi:hypothetical protein